MRRLTIFVTGFLFGIGLIISGMTQPAKVIGFLSIGPDWDPSLAFVMLGAVAVYALSAKYILKKRRPVFEAKFFVPTARNIDPRLLGGAALFGLGWGIAGYCPGPALVSFGGGSLSAIAFVAAMLAGMFLHEQTQRARSATAARNNALPELTAHQGSQEA